MNFRKGRPREDLEINLIPFIDVLLVIVIFLMVTTTYSKFTALQITLPTADAQKALEQPFEINVAVDAQGRYAINNHRISARDAQGLADEMQAALKGSGKGDPVVIINADALATHQTVINVLEAARIAGFPKVTFTAQSSNK
ncbi:MULTISPECIES: biopolymer transporter ExbD [unclassified Herbaspirillum]|uniref:ExbD/TolR family protein n=1 Tax=unclassified Herbaspirillum TaxID=2624150 RepID=UPI001150EC98|nr:MULTISPECIES: biopolymer transporter ExbD [unclassified Herbaspirillum]MBB5390751.1 biopolymer transport protein ExbD [Herbaspirillum sp. SJZ102]TQK08765.1 biopolymer transport protein ExbD [Herbaspirillum sp. SJZ130]TQK14548.1 biopolymer transport protein ExbD [Herbaspirillum sp. SJZ106]TWC66435.1 biopolymer transport protein ExbD [Herbaspirillum sp. SJZ099]